MKSPACLKKLDDLLDQSVHYAEFCFRNSGVMAPTLFLLGCEGPMILVPHRLATEDDKDPFVGLARLVCLAYDATACVMATESWLKLARPGEVLDLTEPPSEAVDRQEMVVLMGEDRSGPRQRFLKIIRSDNGKFFNLSPAVIPQVDNVSGRFAQILPPHAPDFQMQSLARAVLKTKKATVVRLNVSPRRKR